MQLFPRKVVRLLKSRLLILPIALFVVYLFNCAFEKYQIRQVSQGWNARTAFSLYTPIEDIRIVQCVKWNPLCRPMSQFTRWIRSTNDLYLGKHWFRKAFIFVKRPDHYVEDESIVLEDMYVDPESGTSDLSDGYHYKGYGLSVSYSTEGDICEVEVLHGKDAREPRNGWRAVPADFLGTGYDVILTVRPCSEPATPAPKVLQASEDRYIRFDMDREDVKIVQFSDLHMSTGPGVCRDMFPADRKEGCEADATTLEFMYDVLDSEYPDLVLLTGDIVNGDTSPDAKTALLKALSPMVERELPFAVIFGNHDEEGDLSRMELMRYVQQVPGSVSLFGNVSGVGNYVIDSPGKFSLYMIDTHGMSPQGRHCPGYDWIRQDQLDWLKQATIDHGGNPIQMAFLHIPLAEFCDVVDMKGSYREACSATKCDLGTAKLLKEAGIQVAVAGHDHVNDFCGYNQANHIHFCFAGGAGFGGYGGHGGYIRRARIWRLNGAQRLVQTWKRIEWPLEERRLSIDPQELNLDV
ncbi:phosphoprotein phosphatase [Schizosaccharomyces japonicus yFS275]|uniref:Phosphoprotein phosphatase n=1 Tax=Schizosaccharomyces japonicus (strain yFS275 / FY16936) TaxID=402676 RepID=B6K6D3_SCHJY|nr:phosphoprotein phosphatase [Schizosaccharomyces japonicus yFS275]EEB09087.1 phosphoprotein phosphatase [Schizosaccharomyces japonicus yFS275]